MSNTMKRQTYVAPAAELVCLAPSVPIASWKWQNSGHNWKQNSWGDLDPEKLFNLASVTGVAEWLDDETPPGNPDLK